MKTIKTNAPKIKDIWGVPESEWDEIERLEDKAEREFENLLCNSQAALVHHDENYVVIYSRLGNSFRATHLVKGEPTYHQEADSYHELIRKTLAPTDGQTIIAIQ